MTEITLPHAHGTLENRALQALPSVKDCAAVADVFKQLGDGSRLRLFFLLCHSEECVINLASLLNMTSPAISHHLRQRKAAGLTVRASMRTGYIRLSSTNTAMSGANPSEPGSFTITQTSKRPSTAMPSTSTTTHGRAAYSATSCEEEAASTSTMWRTCAEPSSNGTEPTSAR